jgi:hypothetical protein
MCDVTDEARPFVNFVDMFHFVLEFVEALRDQFWDVIYEKLISQMSGLDKMGRSAFRCQKMEAMGLLNEMLSLAYEQVQPRLRQLVADVGGPASLLGDTAKLHPWPALGCLKAFFEFYLPLVMELRHLMRAGSRAFAANPAAAPDECARIFDILVGELLPKLGAVAGWWGKVNYCQLIWTELARIERLKQSQHPVYELYRRYWPYFSQRCIELFHAFLADGISRSNFKAEYSLLSTRAKCFVAGMQAKQAMSLRRMVSSTVLVVFECLLTGLWKQTGSWL